MLLLASFIGRSVDQYLVVLSIGHLIYVRYTTVLVISKKACMVELIRTPHSILGLLVHSSCTYYLLGEKEQLSICDARPNPFDRRELSIVLKAKIPPQNLHRIEQCHHGVLLVVLLKIVIHMGGVVKVKLTNLKLNALSFSDTLNDAETLVESIYQLRSNGGSMQGEVLLRGHLKARRLDFECLFDNHVRHLF